jgi:hypothetical protein
MSLWVCRNVAVEEMHNLSVLTNFLGFSTSSLVTKLTELSRIVLIYAYTERRF